MSVVNVLTSYAKNGVVIMSHIKLVNYPLFKYCSANIDNVEKALSDKGVALVKHRSTMSIDKARLMLLYHYGDSVNINDLYSKHRYLYNYLCSFSEGVGNLIKEMGFTVSNKCTTRLLKQLNKTANNGVISRLDKPTYDKLYYRATKYNLSVTEYLNSQGLRLEPKNKMLGGDSYGMQDM